MCRAYRLTKVSQNKWSYEYDAIGSVMKIADPLSKFTVTPKRLIGGYTFEKAVGKSSDFSSASVAKNKESSLNISLCIRAAHISLTLSVKKSRLLSTNLFRQRLVTLVPRPRSPAGREATGW
jgi:hypothetical protein